eukprot:TRINITY_DN43449_c0_g1_i2.p1 TRINITY_DN43449_c0_g1~~TRINITY_DN43449_c0_g1_i2.p1  ORF type:complete len:206 (+),score=32.06 TRINITY_DN43449_c0_g1_i2:166-783(+)
MCIRDRSRAQQFDLATGKCIRSLEHGGWVQAVAASQCGVATVGDGGMCLWDLRSSSTVPAQRACVDQTIYAAAWMRRPETLALGVGSELVTWEPRTARCHQSATRVQHSRRITCLQVRDWLVVTGSFDRTVRVWSGLNGQLKCIRMMRHHASAVQCVAWPDLSEAKTILSGAQDGDLAIHQFAQSHRFANDVISDKRGGSKFLDV